MARAWLSGRALFATLTAVGVSCGMLALGATPASAVTCTNSWNITGSGLWSVPGNWSAGHVPTSAEDVCITMAGTYTVTLQGTFSVNSLTLGGTSGAQTLTLQGDNTTAYATLNVAADSSIGALGSMNLISASTAGYYATLNQSSGTLSNSGTINVQPPTSAGINDFLDGNVANTGTVSVNGPLTMGGSGTTFTNNGTLAVATGLTVTANNSVTDAGGTISAAGTGQIVLCSSCTYTQGNGKTSGTAPVVADNSFLTYTGTGKSTVIAKGNGVVLSGNIAAGQTLTLEANNITGYATVTASASWTNAGTINLTSPSSAGYYATLATSAGTFTNAGALNAKAPTAAGISDNLTGTVSNQGTVAVEAGAKLAHGTGTFTQTSTGTLKTNVANATSYGVFADSATPILGGTLAVNTISPFVPSVGQTYTVITAPSLTGSFTNYAGVVVGSLVYGAHYNPTNLQLIVSKPSITVSPSSGIPGSTFTITGTGWFPGDPIKISFSDAGVKTTLATPTADASGNFSMMVAVPAGSAMGAATVKAKDNILKDKVKQSYMVT